MQVNCNKSTWPALFIIKYKTMSTNTKIIIVVVVLALVGFIAYSSNMANNVAQVPQEGTENGIIGCYVSRLAQDVYTLKITGQKDGMFTGSLSFDNFEKDSSSGIYVGTYSNDVLLGDYSFASEGLNSVMEVIFKKDGENFVRGYGDMNSEGTRFTDASTVTYDPNQTFMPTADCPI